MHVRSTVRRALSIAGLAAMAVGVIAPATAAADAEAGVFTGQSSVSMNSAPTYLRSCVNIPPASGSAKINWTYNSATGARGIDIDGCVWINRLGATSSEIKVEYLRPNNTVFLTRTRPCSKNLTVNPYSSCGLGWFSHPLTTNFAKIRITLRTTSPASPPSVLVVVPGASAEQDSVSINSAPSYIRSCANIPPNSGSTKVNWNINSSGNVAVTFDGCLWINRLGSTSSRLTVEYRRANNTLITTRTMNCSKGLTANPYQKCVLTGLNLPATAGLDRVVLKLQTLSPTSALATTTVISGD